MFKGGKLFGTHGRASTNVLFACFCSSLLTIESNPRPGMYSTIRMSLAPIVQTIAFKASEASQLIAVKDGDFGGYTGPIFGLLIIGVIIAVLTPPVKE